MVRYMILGTGIAGLQVFPAITELRVARTTSDLKALRTFCSSPESSVTEDYMNGGRLLVRHESEDLSAVEVADPIGLPAYDFMGGKIRTHKGERMWVIVGLGVRYSRRHKKPSFCRHCDNEL